MSFTVLPLTQPQSRNGLKGFTQATQGAVTLDVSVSELLDGSKPVLRDEAPMVLSSKVDLKKVATLWTRGVMPNEISEVMGLNDVVLDELLRSEEFAEHVNAMLATREITSFDKALESTSAEALLALRDLIKNCDNPSVRAKCAMYIIDQQRGKAPQHIQLTGGKIVEDPQKEILRLKEKLKLS